MTFKLACGDVMPGCTAHFEAGSRDDLLRQVVGHASAEHAITDITPEIAEAVSSRITVSA